MHASVGRRWGFDPCDEVSVLQLSCCMMHIYCFVSPACLISRIDVVSCIFVVILLKINMGIGPPRKNLWLLFGC